MDEPAVTVEILEDSVPFVSLAWASLEPHASASLAAQHSTGHSDPPTVPPHRSEMRRRQWLAGRIALTAGLIARGLLPAPHGSHLVGITDGSRRMVTLGGVPLEPAVQVSLSHSGLHVVCALQAKREPGLGIDVEEDWESTRRNLCRFATEEELFLLREACGECTPAHLWCAKEAIAKATGWGFTIAPKRYQILPPLAPDTLEVNIARLSRSAGRFVSRVVLGSRLTPSSAAWAMARVWPWDDAEGPAGDMPIDQSDDRKRTAVGCPSRTQNYKEPEERGNDVPSLRL